MKFIIDRIKNYISFYLSKKYIYLTFDDGPLLGTKNCYNLCIELNVKATFFMVGAHVDTKCKSELLSIMKQSKKQICIANHSFSHANEQYVQFYKNTLNAEEDFYKCQIFLKLSLKLIRLPGFNAWAKSGHFKSVDLVKPICHLLTKSGYEIIGWDLEYNSYIRNRPILEFCPEVLIDKATSLLKKNQVNKRNKLVILLHDTVFQDPNNIKHLKKFIYLIKKSRQFKFETIENY